MKYHNMKKLISFLSICILTLILIGCGKSNENESVENEESNVELQREELEPVPEPMFDEWVEIEQYKSEAIADLISIYDKCGVEYNLSSNGDVIMGKEESYVLLDYEYDITEIAYSVYNPSLNTIDTVFSFKYDVHEEKGLEADSKHAKLLYELIKYFGYDFSSVEVMTTYFNDNAGSMLDETDFLYFEARDYSYYASGIKRKECDYIPTEYKFMNFDSLEAREIYMDTLELEVENKFKEYENNGGHITDSNGEPLIRFRCVDANDAAGLNNDLGLMVSFLDINASVEYRKDCTELIKIVCDYIGVKNMTEMEVTSQEIAEQIMTYVEIELYFIGKDEPMFSWQQEGGWDKLFSPVEYFNSNPLNVQYENAKYYEWNKGDNVYQGIYIPATVQGLKNR